RGRLAKGWREITACAYPQFGGCNRRSLKSATSAGSAVPLFATSGGDPFGEIASNFLLVVGNSPGGVSEMFFVRGQKCFEPVFIDGFHERLVRTNDTLLKQRPDGIIHELHALALARDNYILEFLSGAFADNCGHRS